MIDRNRDLLAFQDRARAACGGDFATIPGFAKALGIGRDPAHKLMQGLRSVGGRYMVIDMAERVYDELHPKPKRLG